MDAKGALKEVNKEGKRKVMIRQQWIWVAALVGMAIGFALRGIF